MKTTLGVVLWAMLLGSAPAALGDGYGDGGGF